MPEFLTTETTITRDVEGSPRDKAPWKLGFTRRLNVKASSTNVEWMTQGELITLWQQIGVLFNLSGMRDGLTDDEIKAMGIIRE